MGQNAREITIRKAVPGDASEIYGLLTAWLQESDTEYPEANYFHTMEWIVDTISNPHNGAAVAVSDDVVVGTIGVGLDTYWWNHDVPLLRDRWVYVLPEFRSGGTAESLMKWARMQADQRGIHLLMAIIMPQRNLAATERFYERSGLKYRGGMFGYIPEER